MTSKIIGDCSGYWEFPLEIAGVVGNLHESQTMTIERKASIGQLS